MLSGGSASGKTEFMSEYLLDKPIIIVDGTLPTLCRLEILMSFGREATEEFTSHYQSLCLGLHYGNLPFWDLCAALHPAGKMAERGLDDVTLHKLHAGHKEFVDQPKKPTMIKS